MRRIDIAPCSAYLLRSQGIPVVKSWEEALQRAGEAVMLGVVLDLLMVSMATGCDGPRHAGALDQDGGSWHGEKAG